MLFLRNGSYVALSPDLSVKEIGTKLISMRRYDKYDLGRENDKAEKLPLGEKWEG